MGHCSHGRQGYSLLGRWDVESQFRQVCAMSEKIPGKARPAAVGKAVLGVGLGVRHGSRGGQVYSLLGRWDVESQFRQV